MNNFSKSQAPDLVPDVSQAPQRALSEDHGLGLNQSPRVGFVSLGCPKALVDSERILTRLRAEGYEIAPDYGSADVVVINTCGFIEQAIEESLEAIDEALVENGRVIVTGCLGKDAERIQTRFPGVLGVSGPAAYDTVLDTVHKHLSPPTGAFESLIPPGGIKLTPRHYAYLKISEGCNHRCSFCIIPSLRGDLVSRPIGAVLDEAERLFEAGVRELLVVSQDTSAYGVDLRFKTAFHGGRPVRSDFAGLAEKLGEIAARHDAWVRLHYVYPYPHVDHVIDMMALDHCGLLPYLDMPLQHGAPRILKAMRRPAAAERMLSRIADWRARRPQLTLRSTFIVGFPGETEAEFEALLEFLREAQIDRAGVFPYSPVEGAAANALPDPIPEAEKMARVEAFFAVQDEISAARLAARVGCIERVLVDEMLDDGSCVARSQHEAPEVDGVIIVHDVDAQPGEWLDVRIVGAREHDLDAVEAV